MLHILYKLLRSFHLEFSRLKIVLFFTPGEAKWAEESNILCFIFSFILWQSDQVTVFYGLWETQWDIFVGHLPPPPSSL